MEPGAVARFFCRVGWHKWQVFRYTRIQPLAGFPDPRFFRLRCRRCGARTWDFRP